MFKTEREMAIALATSDDGYTDDDGNVYKCVNNIDNVLGNSPFRVYRNGEWEEINSFWGRFAQMKKIPIAPDLPVDTKVLVRKFEINKWTPRHFMKWDGQEMVCFDNGGTSFIETDIDGTSWKYWKIDEGKYEGKQNF